MNNRAGAQFHRWLYHEYSIHPSDWSFSRTLLAGYLLIAHLPRALAVPSLPASWYDSPLSIAALTTTFAPYPVVWALNFAAIALATSLLYDLRVRLTGPLLTVCLVALNTVAYSTGKIDHDLLVVLAPSLYLVTARKETDSAWVLAWFALVIALFMSQSGAAKIRGGWLNLDSSATYGHMATMAAVNGSWNMVARACAQHAPRWAWEFFDWSAVLFELAPAVAMVRLKYFRRWCLLATLFHLGVGLLFEIWFAPNIVAYALFVPWTYMLPALTSGRERRQSHGAQHAILCCALPIWAVAVAAPEVHLEQFLCMVVVVAASGLVLAFAAWTVSVRRWSFERLR